MSIYLLVVLVANLKLCLLLFPIVLSGDNQPLQALVEIIVIEMHGSEESTTHLSDCMVLVYMNNPR